MSFILIREGRRRSASLKQSSMYFQLAQEQKIIILQHGIRIEKRFNVFVIANCMSDKQEEDRSDMQIEIVTQ